MTLPLPRKEEKYSYRDYLSWPDEERWELIEGVPYGMTPAPSRFHQEILGEIFRQFSNYLVAKKCRIYMAPFDVRLPESNEADEEVETVVQPDLVVVCDPSKLDKKGVRGAPDLIIEITSPATARKDQREKFFLYEKAGVKEYWIVNAGDRIITVFKLDEHGKYGRPEIYSDEESIEVGLFSGDLAIDLKPAFSEKS
ncbi:MAG: Uma2 family endonuclease [bacterium]